MTPQQLGTLHALLGEMTEQEATVVLQSTMMRIGGLSDGGVVKARALQRLMDRFLDSGFPEDRHSAQVLRQIRNDIDLRLSIAEQTRKASA